MTPGEAGNRPSCASESLLTRIFIVSEWEPGTKSPLVSECTVPGLTGQGFTAWGWRFQERIVTLP